MKITILGFVFIHTELLRFFVGTSSRFVHKSSSMPLLAIITVLAPAMPLWTRCTLKVIAVVWLYGYFANTQAFQ
jgi:hypothetical protein